MPDLPQALLRRDITPAMPVIPLRFLVFAARSESLLPLPRLTLPATSQSGVTLHAGPPRHDTWHQPAERCDVTCQPAGASGAGSQSGVTLHAGPPRHDTWRQPAERRDVTCQPAGASGAGSQSGVTLHALAKRRLAPARGAA